MIIDVDSKYLKKLNDMNQDAKSVFGDEYILYNGAIYSNTQSYTETHLGFTDYEFYKGIDKSIPLYIYSRNIYRIIKNLKKNVSAFHVNEFNSITAKFVNVSDNDMCIVENRVPVKITNNIASKQWNINHIKPHVFDENIYVDAYTLSTNEVLTLVGNGLLSIDIHGYTIRIARSLIPGLKKSHIVKITTFESEIPDIYNIHILVNRASMDTLHIYRGFDYR